MIILHQKVLKGFSDGSKSGVVNAGPKRQFGMEKAAGENSAGIVTPVIRHLFIWEWTFVVVVNGSGLSCGSVKDIASVN